MKKNIWAILVIALAACLLVGCGAGETSSGDLQAEKEAIKKQTPANLEPVSPGNDMQKMGAPSGETNMMPKGIRDKK